MITSLPSGNLSVTPATRDRPRIVTPEAIAAFECNIPALKGIGAIMVDLGIWVVENGEKTASKDSERAPAKARSKDTQHQQGAMNVDNYCISEAV